VDVTADGQGKTTMGPDSVERPQAPVNAPGIWGSDVIADMLRTLDLPYVALNPGASFRGLHDSIVNHLGNAAPQMLLCLHEEAAVAIAHGYAKVAERPMGAIVHSNVGLMHATMAIFNAWCDRVPVLVFGATGPVDAAKRRPWIDWIHTAQDQGALVRNYTKWDDQPASAAAAIESMLRANLMARTAPQGPTYVCLDAALQEAKLDSAPSMPDMARYQPAPPALPAPALVDDIARRLHGAARPLILLGRMSRREEDWANRVALAEALGAVVLSDGKVGATFPTSHPLYGAPAGSFAGPEAIELLRQADIVLAFDCIDLGGTLTAAWRGARPASYIINVSADQYVHNGWSMDYQALPPADLRIMAETDPVIAVLRTAVERLGKRQAAAWPGWRAADKPKLPDVGSGESITVPLLAATLRAAVGDRKTCLMRKPLSWAGHMWEIAHPLDALGDDGGGGIGSGPGMSVGSALALRGSGRLPVSVLGDGDFLMGVTGLWTAVHYGIPMLVVVANNRSYFNDEIHQDRVARERGRPVANRWIGQRMSDPELDLATMARGQGAVGYGPVRNPGELPSVLRQAIADVDAGKVAVVDVRVEAGYDPSMASAMVRAAKE
jgi:thiamine pyrophosphate-dependent acetolactate synthase large subunit-like protein